MKVLILNEKDLRTALKDSNPIDDVEQGFKKLTLNEAVLPGIISLEIPEKKGEFHIKGAYLQGSPFVVFKSANSYYDNPVKGLPSSSGLFFAFDSDTGFIKALMFDNSFLTHVRTGISGAIGTKYLSNKDLKQVLIAGCGTQGRFQWEYLKKVRSIKKLKLWDIDPKKAEEFQNEIKAKDKIDVSVVTSLKDTVPECDCITTVTPSKKPFISLEWISKGTHINAVGADNPDKQELDERIYGIADVIIVDRKAQCVKFGETHHAIENNIIKEEEIDGEIGDVIAGKVCGRTSVDQITICDLTGVGVQDAAIAAFAIKKATEKGLGTYADIS